MKIKIVILGVGRWGRHLVRNLAQNPQAEIIAIVDPSQERLNDCRDKLLANQQVIMATDWQAVRLIKDIDAVVIATPASTHYPLIADALELGYHVLAEKPLTLDTQECLQLTQLAQNKQLQLLVDHTYLFNSIVSQGAEIVQSGKLGDLRYGYSTRTHIGPVRQDVDVLWDLAIHDLAILNHWLGDKPIQVQATGNVWLQPGLADLVWVNLTYKTGFQAYIHLCWLNPDKQRRLCMVGSEGTLIFDEMSPTSPLTIKQGYLDNQAGSFIPTNLGDKTVEIEKSEPLKKVCASFLENINQGKYSAFSSGWVATELVHILNCLRLSLQQGGKIINVPPLKP